MFFIDHLDLTEYEIASTFYEVYKLWGRNLYLSFTSIISKIAKRIFIYQYNFYIT